MKKVLNISLLLAAALLVGCSQPEENPGTGGETPEVKTDVQTFVSTADNTMHFDKIGKNFNEGFNTNIESTVYLKPSKTYQRIDGFGFALNGSACYNLMQMSQADRTKLLTETFSVDKGMGYSYIRVSIGCSDFSLSEFTCCDTKGIENFALTSEDLNYVIPVVKEALTINPQLKVMGSPWTCPIWMKVADLTSKAAYNSWIGGYLNPDYYQDYATYFVKWVQAFEEAGIPIESVTVQNEPLNWGNSASLYMEWDQQRDFIKVLGPAFEQNNIKAKIICFDHNYNYDGKSTQQQYPAKIYADATASQYVEGAGYHHYGGQPSEMTAIHNLYPGKSLYFTEGSIGTWNYQSYEQSFMDIAENVCFKTVENWAQAAILWNFMLDNSSDGEGPWRPHGCSTCYGALQLDKSSHTIRQRRGAYYAIGQMSSVLRTGSTRIGVNGYKPTNVSILATQNLDGTYGIVFLNKNSNSVKLTVDDGTHTFDLTLPAQSMTSCVWPQ